MKSPTTLILALATLALLSGIAGLLVHLSFSKTETNSDAGSTQTALHGSQIVDTQYSTSPNGDQTLSASGQSPANAFISGVDVATTTWDAGDYYILHFADDEALAPDYEIYYFQNEDFFHVGIFEEPIGEVRRTATADLANRLSMSESELCALPVRVTIPKALNSYYARTNLGLPGCLDSTLFSGDPVY